MPAKEDADSRLMPKLTDNDRTLYNRMIHEITNRRLYLDTSLTKQDLLKEFHIPTNKFSILFKEFAGCSFTQYIQQCRLDHATRLMRKHPQWSFEAIAKRIPNVERCFLQPVPKEIWDETPPITVTRNCPKGGLTNDCSLFIMFIILIF